MSTAHEPKNPGRDKLPAGLRGIAMHLEETLASAADRPAWSLSPAEQRETLRVLHRVESGLAELRLRVLAAADRNQVGEDSGATSTAAWLADEEKARRSACQRAVALALELDENFPATRAALAAGRIDEEKAALIVQAVNRLASEDDDLPAGTHQAAEAHLLEIAAEFDAVTLRRVGKRLYEVVCPEAADAAEGAALAAEEAHARRVADFWMHDRGDGTTDGGFRLPTLHATVLGKAVQALTAPRRIGAGRVDPDTGAKVPYRNLLGRGFMDLLEHHLAIDTLPSQGGSPFTVLVTVGLDQLRSELGAAGLETGDRLSAGEVRRLCCAAGIIPMVLGGDSMPLDLGREQRLFSRYQRIAMNHRYKGCATQGCDRPPSWTEAHHPDPWREGGRTDLANGIPLCPPHHHMADHPQSWNLHRMPSGKVRFTRRQ
jgi:hypothetical protein